MAASKTLDPGKHGVETEKLQEILRENLIGQDEAIAAVVEGYELELAGLAPKGRPVRNYVFLGPTGVGKTRLVELLAKIVLGNERAMVKIDCGEFQHSHEIAKLVGSPPGYLGHKETKALLTQERLDQHHTAAKKLSFILFDEIEKAHDSVRKMLLGVLDKGQLTLGDNSVTDFSRSMVFMTSNLGAFEMAKETEAGVGFASLANLPSSDKLSHLGLRAMAKRFSPEFVNRIDKTVVFNSLTRAGIEGILDLELKDIQRRIYLAGPWGLVVSDKAKQWLLDRGYDPKYGARNLKRVLERELVVPMASLISSKQLNGATSLVKIGVDGDGKLEFRQAKVSMVGSGED